MSVRGRAPIAIILLSLFAGMSVFITGFLVTARAQNVFERLVMPGPLHRTHEKLEGKCEACHEPFARTSQVKLCTECHKKIADDRSAKLGFHGRSPDAAAGECRVCHAEHQGRDADLLGLDPNHFNHALTRFPLSGSHRVAECGQCHALGKKHRDAAHNCNDCHSGVDPHSGRLGEKCTNCHSEDRWRPSKPFNHVETRFPLHGGHQKVECVTCHIGEIYKGTPDTCVGCHAINDPHKGKHGEKCTTCHSEANWKSVHFKHDVATRFPLRGAHANVKCDGCHRGGDLQKERPPTTCSGCHKHQDPHKGQLGTRCETCHNEQAWRGKSSFDHDLTRFPLVGRHAQVACVACHKTPAYKEAPRTCAACHADAFHQGRFGGECVRCHTSVRWKDWHFDHARQTRYPLTGAHASARCHGCHTPDRIGSGRMPSDCQSCHAKDDVHRGSFGPNCQQCHVTTTFKLNVLRR